MVEFDWVSKQGSIVSTFLKEVLFHEKISPCHFLFLVTICFFHLAIAEEQIASIHITSQEMLLLTDKSKKATGYFEYHGTDGREVTGYITAKIQGTSSMLYPKKNYNIRFYADEACSESLDVTFQDAWGEHSKYCLKANWIDVTHSRNIVSARLYARAQERYGLFSNSPNHGVIDGFFVEVYVNGEYHGLYTLNLPKAAWLYGLDKNNENHIAMMARGTDSNSSVGFVREAEPENGVEWEIEVGPDSTQADIDACFEKLNRLIRFVKDSSDEEFVTHFSEYLNLDACLNYYAFLYRSNAIDNKTKNMILVTFDGSIWYPVLYDLDSTWGLYIDGTGLFYPYDTFPQNQNTCLLWDRFASLFGKQIKERYNELCSTVWSQESITNAFTEFATSIPQEAYERDRAAWPELQSLCGSLEQIIEYASLREGYAASCIDQLALSSNEEKSAGILYQLESPFHGSAYSFCDTGINLFSGDTIEQDFTIVLQYRDSAENQENKQLEVLLSNKDEDKNGLIFETTGSNYTMFYAGAHQYEALYHLRSDVYSIIMVKQGDDYTFYADDVSNVRYIHSTAGMIESPANLYLAAQYYLHTDGSITTYNNFTGDIERFEILDHALTTEEVAVLMQELVAGN